MTLIDRNLAAVLQSLTPAERAAVEGILENAGEQPQSEALRALRSETQRRLRRMLKRKARSKPGPHYRWLN